MKSNIIKKICAILVIITLLLPNLSTVLAVTLSHDTTNGSGGDNTVAFAISETGPDGYGYKVNTTAGLVQTYRIYAKDGSSSTPDFSNNIYCLNMNRNFPSIRKNGDTETTTADGKDNYKCIGNFEDKSSQASVPTDKKANLQKLMSVMYIKDLYSDSTEQAKYRENWLKNTLVPVMIEDYYDGMSPEYAYSLIEDANFKEDDIMFVQQLAIWYYTNGYEFPYLTTKDQNGSDILPTERLTFIGLLYSYLTSSNLVEDTAYDVQTSVWEPQAENTANLQYLLLITKSPKQYKATLRKFVSGYTKKNGTYKAVPTSEKRPYADANSSDYTGQSTLINQSNAFDPSDKIEPGDTVEYTIRVYNEGTNPFKVKSIKDYLPDGLDYVSSGSTTNSNNQWAYTISSRTAITEVLNTKNLIPAGGFAEVKIECKVNEEYTGNYLENRAEIEEIVNESGITLTNSNNTKKYSEDPSTHEPDDDNEIIKVTPNNDAFGLRLEKYITTVGNSTKSRSTYSQSQKSSSPERASVGDLVIYTIKVTNDREETGSVTQIKDYLPKGLGYLFTYSETDRWSFADSVTKNTVGDLNLSGTPTWYRAGLFTENPSSINDVQFVEGGQEVVLNVPSSEQELAAGDSVEFQIACIVTSNDSTVIGSDVIKNIAEISGHKDGSGNTQNVAGVDDDSIPDNHKTNPGEDDEDFDVIKPIIPDQPNPDLAIKKFVKSVDGTTARTAGVADGSTIATTGDATYPIDSVKSTTPKINVENGQKVIFEIRVYNEGETDESNIQVIDIVPDGLKISDKTENNIWTMYKESETGTVTFNSENDKIKNKKFAVTENREEAKVITTTISGPIEKYVSGGQVDTEAVEVEFEVTATEGDLTNVAILPDDTDDTDDDREDEDKVTVDNPVYDLALKKYISAVEGSTSRGRQNPTPTNLSSLYNRASTDANYGLDMIKETSPIRVKKDEVVTYTVDVYNEGKVATVANEVKVADIIPEGLIFIETDTNKKWTKYVEASSDDSNTITYNGKKYKETNEYGEDVRLVIQTISNSIPALTTSSISKESLSIDLKVNSTKTSLKNIAEVIEDKEDKTKGGDSTPGNGDESEDDQDDDTVYPAIYDLSVKKFVTKVGKTEITSREPQVTKNNSGELVYTDSTDPVAVSFGDIVEYTIRVYNEGNQDTYAKWVTDDLPEGIEFLPANDTNKEYGWDLYKEAKDSDTDTVEINGKKYVKVEEVSDADIVATKYLAKGNDDSNLIKAYEDDKEVPEYTNGSSKQNNPDYKDVKIAFKVVAKNVTKKDRNIINVATVPDLTDKDGNDQDDDDPEDNEDDEYIAYQYFDLALSKYVSKTIVIEDGVTTERETGYTGDKNSESTPKVEIHRKKIDSTTVKFVYTLKVTNQGEIAGFATEIEDRLPAGMSFYVEDNKEYGWQISDEEGVVTTNYLAKKELKPGESATVDITLRWDNAEDNFDTKTNVAEITEDYNEYGVPDNDSIPGNRKDGEDDQSSADVMLSIKTGSAPMYIGIVIASITLLAIGGYCIKKFVL